MRGIKGKQMKQELLRYYQPPKPDRKQEFLRRFPETGMTSLQFMWIQAGYIKKWFWGMSFAFLLLLLSCQSYFQQNVLNVMAAFAPFIAMSILAESSRAYVYGMQELELAARFSMKSVLLARMGILSLFHFILLFAMIVFSAGSGEVQYFQAGIWILLPYFTSISIGLPFVWRFRGRESGYFCIAVAVVVSVGFLYLREGLLWQVWTSSLPFFGVLLVAEIFVSVMEGMKFLKQSEELL